MPRCAWCGEFSEKVEKIDNGRTVLVLCPLCAAEKEFRESPDLRLEDFQPVGFFEKLRRRFRDLFRGR